MLQILCPVSRAPTLVGEAKARLGRGPVAGRRFAGPDRERVGQAVDGLLDVALTRFTAGGREFEEPRREQLFQFGPPAGILLPFEHTQRVFEEFDRFGEVVEAVADRGVQEGVAQQAGCPCRLDVRPGEFGEHLAKESGRVAEAGFGRTPLGLEHRHREGTLASGVIVRRRRGSVLLERFVVATFEFVAVASEHGQQRVVDVAFEVRKETVGEAEVARRDGGDDTGVGVAVLTESRYGFVLIGRQLPVAGELGGPFVLEHTTPDQGEVGRGVLAPAGVLCVLLGRIRRVGLHRLVETGGEALIGEVGQRAIEPIVVGVEFIGDAGTDVVQPFGDTDEQRRVTPERRLDGARRHGHGLVPRARLLGRDQRVPTAAAGQGVERATEGAVTTDETCQVQRGTLAIGVGHARVHDHRVGDELN